MASSGAAAWIKYFQGKGDIQTAMKKAAIVYDTEIPSKKIADIGVGISITFKQTKKYESKTIIEYVHNRKTIVGRVGFDNIAKPGNKHSGSISLKPQAFGVGDTKYTFSDYKRVVSESIQSRKDLSGELRTYLAALFDHYAGAGTTANVLKIFNNVKDNIPLGNINKDFGEVLGPVAILTKNLLSNKGIVLAKGSAKIYVPSRPNEPLMDYAVIQGYNQYTISAKSGTITNVVKPPDILALLKKDTKEYKKWSTTKEFRILNILSENSILLGPIKVVSMLHPDLISPAAAESVTSKGYDEKGFAKFINSNDYLKVKKTPTTNEIMYECEKMIQNETKNGPINMNNIFSDAIDNQVFYVKFDVNKSTGIGDWDVIVSDDIRKSKYGRVYLRTKNGYTRSSDRMGIQV
jgi:hypothetical protein